MPIPVAKRSPKLTVPSVAPALAEAMRSINCGVSISELLTGEGTIARALAS